MKQDPSVHTHFVLHFSKTQGKQLRGKDEVTAGDGFTFQRLQSREEGRAGFGESFSLRG